MKVRIKIFNMTNINSNALKNIQFSGYIELNGQVLVNCNTSTVEKEIEVMKKNAIIVWKREKGDKIEKGIFNFLLSDKEENFLVIQNAPAFEGVKVLLNDKIIYGKHYYNNKLM